MPADANEDDAMSTDAPGADGPSEARFVVLGTSGALTSILVYEVAADGNLAPLRQFRSFRSLINLTAVQIAGNEIFVGTRSEIQVFDLDTDGANEPDGAAMPKRFVRGTISGITGTNGLAVFGAEMFTTTQTGSIVVHAIEANGEVPPLRTIVGPRSYRWVSVAGDEIFASASDTIDVFPITSNGQTSPTRSIAGTATELLGIRGIHATDTDLFVAIATDNHIRAYPVTASGDVPPVRKIRGLDPEPRPPTVVGNELFVAHMGPEIDGAHPMGSYSVVSTTADGFVTPLRHVQVGGSNPIPVFAIDAN